MIESEKVKKKYYPYFNNVESRLVTESDKSSPPKASHAVVFSIRAKFCKK